MYDFRTVMKSWSTIGRVQRYNGMYALPIVFFLPSMMNGELLSGQDDDNAWYVMTFVNMKGEEL